MYLISSEGSPHKEVPSVTNAMTISDKQGTDQNSITEANFTNEDLDLNSQPLHPPDTYDRLEAVKPTDPSDVYDKLEPRQPLHPTNTYDKLPASSTFDQLPSANATYDKLPPSKTIHNFPSTNTYDKLPASNATSDNSPSNNTTYDKLPSTPPNAYDRLPSSNTFDRLPSTPSTDAYDKLPSSNTFHRFPLSNNNNDKLPSTPPDHYNKLPPSRTFDKLPPTPIISDRLPATGAYTPSPQTKVSNSILFVCSLASHSTSVLMIRVENCPDICFHIVNLLTSPLIVHSKFVWSNLVDRSNAKVGRKMSDDWLLS